MDIYNLKSIGINNEYEITYKVYTVKTHVNIFKKFFKWVTGAKDFSISIVNTQPSTEDISQELIAIDLNKLTNGAYQLEIVIADTKDKAIMASAQKEFILID